ncbi:hypothetical protein TSUD_240580 [Trifolium subterraneum]|uniref:Uncharacterized protein n=1 Tax=Trifolium subterraneum TaxID=3900 RepID=A0A2Z6PH81_TRISU|nr:hypothetical protein TSUD_240580 [Trifolium subterraneum]
MINLCFYDASVLSNANKNRVDTVGKCKLRVEVSSSFVLTLLPFLASLPLPHIQPMELLAVTHDYRSI